MEVYRRVEETRQEFARSPLPKNAGNVQRSFFKQPLAGPEGLRTWRFRPKTPKNFRLSASKYGNRALK